jgi:hypothetical protein
MGILVYLLAVVMSVCGSFMPCLAQQSGPVTLENVLDDVERSPLNQSEVGPSSVRHPVPDQAAVKRAQDLIKQAFEDDYKTAAENPEPLIQKLLAAAEGTEEASRKYAMLLEAEKVAVLGADHGRAMELIDVRAGEFQIDGIQARVDKLAEFLTPKAKTDPDALGKFYEYAIETTELGTAKGSLKQAKASGEMAASIAKSLLMLGKAKKNAEAVADAEAKQSRAQSLIKAIAGRASLLAEYQKALETLKTMPDDPSASSVVGRYLCFAVGDWDKGLPFLAKGKQREIADVAANELKVSAIGEPEPKRVFELAGSWWEVAVVEGKSHAADTIFRHASNLYASINEKLADPLDKALASKRAVGGTPELPNGSRGLVAESRRPTQSQHSGGGSGQIANGQVVRTSVKSGIDVGNADLDPGDRFIISFEVRTRSEPGAVLITKRHQEGASSLTLQLSDNGSVCAMGDGPFYRAELTGRTKVNDGQWHLVKVMKNDGLLLLVIDGVDQGTLGIDRQLVSPSPWWLGWHGAWQGGALDAEFKNIVIGDPAKLRRITGR